MMRVFVTGGTGVMGRPVLRMLRDSGHQVRALARSESNENLLRRVGAEAVRADLFDPASLHAAVEGCEAVLHLATRIPSRSQAVRRAAWSENTRIRIDGTRNLVDAALASGAGTLLYPGICFVYADGGDAWLSADQSPVVEGDALSPTLGAEAEVARFAAAGRRGITLRMGYFYGTGAESTLDTLAMARRGAAVLAGRGDAWYPSLWVEDAATAVVAALDRAPAGTWDVVDDEPLTRRELARTIAAAAGWPFVMRPPGWLLKLVGGADADFMLRSQRVSNARFKAATGWAPAVRSAREGWPLVARSLHQPAPGRG